MSNRSLLGVLGRVGTLVAGVRTHDVPDGELLTRFLEQRDETAFAAIVERHGGMVLGVCRRLLRDSHEAEDACQAAFLVLARSAAAVRKRGSLASWLHGVAWRVARKLRSSRARRAVRENAVAAQRPAAAEPADLSLREVLQLLDEELQRLPARYQAPLVLCHLEGRTQDEAARELGWSDGMLRGRLLRGRELLRVRLLRRGVAPAALAIGALAPGVCSAALPVPLAVATSQAGAAVAAGESVSVPATVTALADALLHADKVARLQMAAGALASLALLGLIGVLAFPTMPARPAETWSQATRLEGPPLHAWTVAFSPDGTRLAAGYGGTIPSPGALIVWDAASRERLYALDTPRSVRSLAFAPDGATLVSAEHDSVARIRRADSGVVLATFEAPRTNIDAAAFAPDGKLVATSCWDSTVTLWDAAAGRQRSTLRGRAGPAFAVTFLDSGTVASGAADGHVLIQDAATGDTLRSLRGHGGVVQKLATSPDGRLLASASWDRTVKLWDPATGRLQATLHGHAEPVLSVAFSPDSRLLVACTGRWGNGAAAADPSPAEALVWDLASRKPLARLPHTDRVFDAAFAPDGKLLATASWDGSVTLWNCPAADQAEAPGTVEPGLARQFRVTLAAEPDDAEPRRDYPQDYHPALTARPPGLRPLGPEVDECVRFEPAGLRIKLPRGHPRQRAGTGVVTEFAVRGDFEITVAYELLAEPGPAGGGNPTDLKVMVVPAGAVQADRWHKPTENRAYLACAAASPHYPRRFVADLTHWNNETIPRDQWGNEQFDKVDVSNALRFPATAPAGRLRLVRAGTRLSFHAADGADKPVTFLHADEFGNKDLKEVRIVASTGGPGAEFDVRITDLQIRAEALPSSAQTLPAPAAAAAPPRRWWLAVLVVAVAALAGVSLALLPYLRRRTVAMVVAAILTTLSSCSEQTPPAPEAAEVPHDLQVLQKLDYFEPWFKLDERSRVVSLRLVWRDVPPAVAAEVGKLSELVSLDCVGSTMSDDGLAQLKGLHNLRSFGLGHTDVTDDGLVHLQKLQGLQHVWLTRRRISQEAVERLKAARPELNIYVH